MEGWERALSDLERATSRLSDSRGKGLLEAAEAMSERAAALSRVRDLAARSAQPASQAVLNRLRADWERGELLTEALLLRRAEARAELHRMTSVGQFLRALRSPPASLLRSGEAG
jgi:hypothetical protein